MTAETKEILREHEWLNHEQFSPTDPTLIMFCHEGTWHEADRIWTICTDGTLFAGDGGDSEMVARAPDGKWFYLFRPERVRTQPESRPQTRQS